MDDPWGSSPWADEIQLPIPSKTKEDAPRPTTPVRAPNLGLEEKIASPWGDDDDNDGFGDWAALPGDQAQTFGLDEAADGWGKHTADTVDLTNGHANALPPTDWDAHQAVGNEKPSVLAPSLFPRAPELMRQPSPDPWALEVQEEEEEPQITQIADNQDQQTSDDFQALQNGRLASPILDISLSNETLVPAAKSGGRETTTAGEHSSENLATKDPGTRESFTKALDGEPGSESQESDPLSRPSSSPSERSHHDELLQESPRTSFDEEPKPNRPQIPRKVSTKVHELVQHFDTLAKQEDPEPVVPRTSSSQNRKLKEDSEQEGDTNDDDDFGDFEEGQSDDEEPELENTQTSGETVSQSPSSGMSKHQRPPSRDNALTKDYGVVEYKFDSLNLGSIFPTNTPDPTSETIFIPDSLPFESFSSTEQRKTWYRVSRYGTMRKHNSGNDENYVRIGWKPSTIRDDTLKIVSRWIEEDRISGRVVLGGGSKGSTVFGWNDPKAPAVPLSDVFVKHGKKMSNMNTAVESASELPREWPKGLVRDRSTSKTHSPPSKPRRKGSVMATSVQVSSDVQKNPVVPVANFGWSGGVGAADQNVGPASVRKRLSGIVSDPVLLSNSEPPPPKSRSPHSVLSSPLPTNNSIVPQKFTPAVVGASPSNLPAQKSVPLPTLSMSTVVNDDDWGEMVSTPATPTLPVLPPSKGLQHKKSQSFGGISTNIPPGGTLKGWIKGQPETSHRSSTSFDEILTPQMLVPTSSSPHVTSNVDLFPTGNPVDAFTNATPQAVAMTLDPWASADFSFFETAPAPAPMAKPVPLPVSKAPGPKSVKFNTPSPASPRRNRKSREELEHDRIVQNVVKGLPDLSYMFKK
ncbi:hypothetical protein BKA65DRAFT_511614 [Rhexocercosporidium sp. MPI-PUGE-AT-0058]|nr:hypothetical protein BKA65DRAFT_511614 [Rhexocercosporidium sp. MPI-PUGE-AT-0058]